MADLPGWAGIQVVRVEGVDVTVALTEPLTAGARGTLLMDYEDHLRQTGFPEAVVWHEPMGDRSSLRNLRGIEIKR